MLNYARVSHAIVFGAMTLAATPSFAASAATDAFAANIRLNAAYLAVSSKLAATNAQSDGIKMFASAERNSQADLLAALDGWQANQTTDEPSTKVASNTLDEGRSVAADDSFDVTKFSSPNGVGALMPAAAMTLEHLSAMKGAAFDALYKAVDTNVLKQIAGFCEAYAETGDDPALRDLARAELARAHASLDALAKV